MFIECNKIACFCHFVFKKPPQKKKNSPIKPDYLLNSNGFYLCILCCNENKSFCDD